CELSLVVAVVSFLFFQAEDGIRDWSVTGVQTCALPISRPPGKDLADGTEVEILAWRPRGFHGTRYRVRATRDGLEGWLAVDNLRSEERRVGKEGGAGWAAERLKERGKGEQMGEENRSDD